MADHLIVLFSLATIFFILISEVIDHLFLSLGKFTLDDFFQGVILKRRFYSALTRWIAFISAWLFVFHIVIFKNQSPVLDTKMAWPFYQSLFFSFLFFIIWRYLSYKIWISQKEYEKILKLYWLRTIEGYQFLTYLLLLFGSFVFFSGEERLYWGLLFLIVCGIIILLRLLMLTIGSFKNASLKNKRNIRVYLCSDFLLNILFIFLLLFHLWGEQT